MSSTSTYFQDPAHTPAYMDRHHSEMESQQSYSDNGFGSQLTDSEFPADVNSYYSARAENLYDEARYSGLSPQIGHFELQDAEALQYGRMQDMNMNNYTSPQLLCPRPTLPQSLPQFSWSNWPSEAPVNAYRTYSEPSSQRHTDSIPHSPEVTETQYSFENQQGFSSYPAVQEYPISMAGHHGDSGYAHQPLLMSMSSFERGPAHSTDIQPRYHAAHQPIRPEQHSSYSELAPNLSFMNRQAQAPPTPIRQEKIHTQDHKALSNDRITRTKSPSLDVKKNPYALGLNGPPLTAIGRKKSPPPPAVPDHRVTRRSSVPTPPSAATRTRPSRSVNEPRRPSLACTFCRERKIACGRPPDGSEDLTCNQCARRSFRCRYLDSKSAPSVRSRANSRDSSYSPLKRK